MKREFAIDRFFIVYSLASLIAMAIAILLLIAKHYIPAILVGIGYILWCTLTVAMPPVGYFFDREGCTICYAFLPNERYRWSKIENIDIEDDIDRSLESLILNLLLTSKVYILQGEPEGKKRFYMKGHVRKSKKTRRLLLKYLPDEEE